MMGCNALSHSEGVTTVRGRTSVASMGSGAGAGIEEMEWEEGDAAAGAGASNSEIVDKRGLPAVDETKESSVALKRSVLADMAAGETDASSRRLPKQSGEGKKIEPKALLTRKKRRKAITEEAFVEVRK